MVNRTLWNLWSYWLASRGRNCLEWLVLTRLCRDPFVTPSCDVEHIFGVDNLDSRRSIYSICSRDLVNSAEISTNPTHHRHASDQSEISTTRPCDPVSSFCTNANEPARRDFVLSFAVFNLRIALRYCDETERNPAETSVRRPRHATTVAVLTRSFNLCYFIGYMLIYSVHRAMVKLRRSARAYKVPNLPRCTWIVCFSECRQCRIVLLREPNRNRNRVFCPKSETVIFRSSSTVYFTIQ